MKEIIKNSKNRLTIKVIARSLGYKTPSRDVAKQYNHLIDLMNDFEKPISQIRHVQKVFYINTASKAKSLLKMLNKVLIKEFKGVKEIEGNLLDMFKKGDFDIIAHGCNCFNNMSGGIAAQIAKSYPNNLIIDKLDKRSSLEKLGDMTYWEYDQGIIINIYSQFTPGNDFNEYSLANALIKVNQRFKGCKIGLPLIGCGIGGGEWKSVKKIIEETLYDMEVTIVHYKAK